jgi:hypothetical protein
MTKLKTLSAIALISAAIATPVFAQGDQAGPRFEVKARYELSVELSQSVQSVARAIPCTSSSNEFGTPEPRELWLQWTRPLDGGRRRPLPPRVTAEILPV